MRVIAGNARGARLYALSGKMTRPTSDRVKEALFSIIESRFRIGGVSVLDICAGTGSLGIEALSRDAASCCFVEKERLAVDAVKRNLASVGCLESRVLCMDALKALRILASEGKRFDIIFFDPPYSSDLYIPVIEAVSDFSVLSDVGIMAVESDRRKSLPERIGKLLKIVRRIYGDTSVEIYVLEER